MNRTVLKWAGSKARLASTLRQFLPTGDRLVEPFAGSCAVMMNTDYPSYLVADINPDLIYLYKAIQFDADQFIQDAKRYFELCNSEERYYSIRADFNLCADWQYRAAMFLYLNRHCFNGLCRYNRAGHFNVPYGKYKAPYFPDAEIRAFAEKAKRAIFVCASFEETLQMVRKGDVVYCDPPYLPEEGKEAFTNYHTGGFGLLDHMALAAHLRIVGDSGKPVVVSNSIRAADVGLYGGFDVIELDAPRSIGASADSVKTAKEVLAMITPFEHVLPKGAVWSGFDPAAQAQGVL